MAKAKQEKKPFSLREISNITCALALGSLGLSFGWHLGKLLVMDLRRLAQALAHISHTLIHGVL